MLHWKGTTRRGYVFAGLTTILLVAQTHESPAGGIGFRNSAVGGISIDARGVVGQASQQAIRRLRDEMLRDLQPVEGELSSATSRRKISLKNLEAAIEASLDAKEDELPDEIRYLAGLQRIEMVLVYPEKNDIVLVGPGEGWTIDTSGNVVGASTGLPVVQFDDLVVAFRSVANAKAAGITCSIDPTAEGLRRLQDYLSGQRQFRRSIIPRIKKTLGDQIVTVSGVKDDTHFARVLAAADYRMKRIAMKLEKSPVSGLPSFLDLLKSRRSGLTSMTPRWWLACDYQPIAHSEDGLAWQIRGQGVKTMTENDFVDASGVAQATGQSDPLAREWAEMMTENYEELSRREPIFGQLRNLMDLCVVAALIEKEDLRSKAGCELPLLTDSHSRVVTESWSPARKVGTECSFVKQGRNYIVTASGGVEIDSWRIVAKTEVDRANRIDTVRLESTKPTSRDTWWWD